MIRPDMIVAYAKERGARRFTDFNQLTDGLNVGGRLVTGGMPEQAATLRSVMMRNKRLGQIVSIHEFQDPQLDPFVTYTFDIIAIAQLVMIARNEAFHGTVDTCINLLQKVCVDEKQSIEVGLQLLREKADEVGHL